MYFWGFKMTNSIDTNLIHAGRDDLGYICDSIVPPIFHSSTYAQSKEEHYKDVKYHRLSNTPGHRHLEKILSKIEHSEDSLVVSSGMSAITNLFFSLLCPGDHLLIQKDLYGGTEGLCTNYLEKFFEVEKFCSTSKEDISKKIRPDTKLVYLESISNPLLVSADIEGILSVTNKYPALTAIDNTFLSPVNFRPLEHGIDIVIHSATKYLNGHSDLIAGSISSSKSIIEKLRSTTNYFGSSLDGHSISQLLRGLRTLKLRMERHNSTAMYIAEELAKKTWIKKVLYPEEKSLYSGRGGVVSFYLKTPSPDIWQDLKKLKICVNAPSLGGVESLLTIPYYSTHADVDTKTKESLGITSNLIRLSVGLEDPNDILSDIEIAFK